MYIKEDLIIPHHYTFYDMIVTKARGTACSRTYASSTRSCIYTDYVMYGSSRAGKSGPLFHFDVHDDVRLLANARVEKDESHAGKVVTR